MAKLTRPGAGGPRTPIEEDREARRRELDAVRRRQAERDEEIERRIAAMLRRRRHAMIAAAVLGVVLAAYGGWYLFQGDPVPEGPSAAELRATAVSHQKRGDLAAAARELRRLLILEPQDGDARQQLGNIYVSLGDGSAAEKELRTARALGKREMDVTIALLHALLLQRRYSDVLVTTLDSDDTDAPRILMLTAEAQLGLKQLENADRIFERVLETVHDHVDARLGLVRSHLARGKLEEAEAWLKEAITLDPLSPEARVLEGRLRLAGGRPGEARAVFASLVAEDGSRREARLGLAEALLALGEPGEAMSHLHAAAGPERRSATVRHLEAVAHYLARRSGDAREVVRGLLRDDPEHVDGRFMMARLHEEAEEAMQAERVLERLLRRAPEHVPARTLLATVRLDLGEPASAVEVLEPALEMAPDDERVRTLLGVTYARLGDEEKAAEFLGSSPAAGSATVAADGPTSAAGLFARGRELGHCRLLVRTCADCLYTRECK